MFLNTGTLATQFWRLHLHSLCGATLFGSHQRHLLPSIWQSVVELRLLACVCDAWQRSRNQNLRRVGKNSGLILSCLWTKVHEILGRCSEPLVLSNALIRLSMSCFIQKIFAIKSRKSSKCKSFLAPIFREGWSRLFYGILLARFTVHRLAKFGWVPFAGLRLRSLKMKWSAEFTGGG